VGDFEKRARDPENFGYGYRDTGCTRVRGMRFWVDPRARELVFKKVFRGQITRGIDQPDKLGSGFTRALPENYPKLYDENDGWWLDAIVMHRESETMVIRLAGTGPAGLKAELLIPGQDRRPIESDLTGRFEVSFTVPKHTFPARVELAEISGRNPLRFAFEVGCDGLPLQMGIDVQPTVVVERGDSLWRISRRLVGKGRRYRELAAANDRIIANPRLIYPGQVLRSPWGMPYSLSVGASQAGTDVPAGSGNASIQGSR
jgi:hypothetical protein